MKHKSGSQKRQAMKLEIWIPQRAAGFYLAFIHLTEDLSTEQVAYLEAGKNSGLIVKSDVYE